MLVSFIDALQKGGDMPIDVYDAVTWMSISYLSAKSIEMNGASVEIPDFTNGKYRERPVRDVVKL